MLVCTLLAVHATARSAPPPVSFCSGWRVGDKLDFRAKRIEDSTEPGEKPVRVVSSLPVTVEVLQQDESGYRLAWTYGSTVVEENTGGPLEPWALSLFDGLRMELRTDPAGKLKSVANARTVKEFMVVTRRRMQAELATLDVSAEDRAEMSQALQELTEPQSSAHLALPDAEFLLQICGRTLQLGQRQSADLASSAFETFKWKVSFVLRAVDQERSRATIDWRNDEDPTAKAFLGALLRIVAEMEGRPRQRYRIRNAGQIEFDLELGWPTRVSQDFEVRLGKTSARTRTEIELIPPPLDPT